MSADIREQPLGESATIDGAIAEHDDTIQVVHPVYVTEVARLGGAYERLQKENGLLRDRVDALQAECEHWHAKVNKWAARAITAESTK